MNAVINIPAFTEALIRLRECHESRRGPGKAKHLRLLGQTGVGKTFLLQHYVSENPPRNTDDRQVIPVLLVAIPSSPTVKGFYQAVLKSLGVQGAAGSVEALRHRAVTLIKSLYVELLLLDEISHVVDRGRRRTQEIITDAIKEFVDAIGIPTVFAGAKRAQQLFLANAQLRSRVTGSITLNPFNLDAKFKDLRGFIRCRLSPRMSDEQIKWMASKEMAVRHFYATDGVHRQLAEFLDEMPRWTLEEACGNSYRPVLASLFRKHLWESAPDRLNPYCPEFVFRRLNKPGEPYVPTNLDGDNHDDAA